jgi:hypothetical protein
VVALQTIQQLQAHLRTLIVRIGRSGNTTSIRKESASVALPPVPSPDVGLPLHATPEDPTPDEIQRACQQIQATWSDQERRHRAQVRRPTDLDKSGASREGSRA